MIFYFTGTGNSLYVAQQIAEQQNDRLISIAETGKNHTYTFTLDDNESVGFSFPVYFWGMPTIVEEFLDKVTFTNYKNHYIYAVFNCGGSIGNTDKAFKKRLSKNGYILSTSFSVFMPDNYILQMDLLTPQDKIPILLQETDRRLESINLSIAQRTESNLRLHKKGWPWLSSLLAHPYYKNDRSTKPFHATEACIACGLCAGICPSTAIKMKSGMPVWEKKRCTQCLACLHRCPVQAIQYGKKTYKRGRYLNPNCKWEQ